jgi:hypothetical protein
MDKQPAALSLVALLGGCLGAACGSSGPAPGGSAAARATATPGVPGLPFHHEAQGQSSSPSFQVATAGAYRVDYVLKGSADLPGCVVSINLVADDGSAQPVVARVQLQPTDTRQDHAPVTLSAGRWRFQEGGGCSWSVTVGPA